MKTHVTVIPSDGIISVDGEVLFLDGITSETFHALQWHDGAGHVEPGNGLPNEELSTDDYAGRVAPRGPVGRREGPSGRRGQPPAH